MRGAQREGLSQEDSGPLGPGQPAPTSQSQQSPCRVSAGANTHSREGVVCWINDLCGFSQSKDGWKAREWWFLRRGPRGPDKSRTEGSGQKMDTWTNRRAKD